MAGIGTLAKNLYARPVEQPDQVATRGYPNAGNALRSYDPDKSHRDYGAFNGYPGGGVVSIGWAGQFLSLDVWQASWCQDAGTRKAPRRVSRIRDLRLEYNPTRTLSLYRILGTPERFACGVVPEANGHARGVGAAGDERSGGR